MSPFEGAERNGTLGDVSDVAVGLHLNPGFIATQVATNLEKF
jgi:hypothetical protein